jgi:hypothetical protein
MRMTPAGRLLGCATACPPPERVSSCGKSIPAAGKQCHTALTVGGCGRAAYNERFSPGKWR